MHRHNPATQVAHVFLAILLLPAFSLSLLAQADAPSESHSRFEKEKQFPLSVLKDQLAIWTSPMHMHSRPMLLVGAMGAASAIVAANDDDISEALGHDAHRER